jgi:hypothetical protein
MIDYFSPPSNADEAVLRGIKGNFRRNFVGQAISTDGLGSIPAAWKAHDISEILKGMLQAQHPTARGGEDLPDLEDDEVEIARMTLANSVHGEVTSLRAAPGATPGEIVFRMVDEYETDIEVPITSATAPLTAEEVIRMFTESEPSSTETECEIEFQSYFYPDLNAEFASLQDADDDTVD